VRAVERDQARLRRRHRRRERRVRARLHSSHGRIIGPSKAQSKASKTGSSAHDRDAAVHAVTR
jgi:hypothetical protein